jgi:UDPglucose 6-dehydrogenase/GDP-mannose 6-dehydrogenase
VLHGVFLDKRISPIVNGERVHPELTTYLRAGCGFGGSCFPKDLKTFTAFESSQHLDGGLLDCVLKINDSQIRYIFEMGMQNCRQKAKSIAVLGTAFKPDTDDVRESPGMKLARMGLQEGLSVYVHDYRALDNTRNLLGNEVSYCLDPLKAVEQADIVFVATIWGGYLDISDEDYETSMKDGAILVDCRSLFRRRGDKPWRVRIGYKADSASKGKKGEK